MNFTPVAQKHNEAYVSASSGRSEIMTDERGTREVNHDGFELLTCQVLVWDSRPVVETSEGDVSN
jgi:hypothetical protein